MVLTLRIANMRSHPLNHHSWGYRHLHQMQLLHHRVLVEHFFGHMLGLCGLRQLVLHAPYCCRASPKSYPQTCASCSPFDNFAFWDMARRKKVNLSCYKFIASLGCLPACKAGASRYRALDNRLIGHPEASPWTPRSVGNCLIIFHQVLTDICKRQVPI